MLWRNPLLRGKLQRPCESRGDLAVMERRCLTSLLLSWNIPPFLALDTPSSTTFAARQMTLYALLRLPGPASSAGIFPFTPSDAPPPPDGG